MPQEIIQKIVQKQLKRYKFEIVMLWALTVIGGVLIVTGVGMYFYVDRLAISQYLSTVPIHNFAVSQVKMLHDFSKVLGVVFALVGLVAIVFAMDRLGLRNAAC